VEKEVQKDTVCPESINDLYLLTFSHFWLDPEAPLVKISLHPQDVDILVSAKTSHFIPNSD
jgi:hypothetical protein